MSHSPSFTLIELVIVIGILAVLAAVAVIVINPAEYMKSSRDSQRLSELQTITKAIGLYLGDGQSDIGSTNIVYVSIPDSSTTCANLGLPTLPAGWTYQCSTSANYRKTDGTGWLPINFSSVSFTNPLQTLPIDPVNTTSTGNYYTYTTGGSFELTSYMESSKYKMGGNNDKASKDGGSYPELYETGSNLTLLPVNYGDTSLVGYWKFDEGTGTTAYDASGHGNNGTLTNGPAYTTAKVGDYALSFNGTNNYITMGDILDIRTNDLTIEAWAKPLTINPPDNFYIVSKSDTSITDGRYAIGITTSSKTRVIFDPGNGLSLNGNISLTTEWNYIVATYDRDGNLTIYVNGVYDAGQSISAGNGANYNNTIPFIIGAYTPIGYFFNGIIDDVRIYNRALSAAEVLALYNATNK